MDARKGHFYTLTAPERDRQIVELKRRGVSNIKIAKAVA